MSKHWIGSAITHVHSLHRQMGVKFGRKIPKRRLLLAAKGKGLLAKRARLALTLESFHK